jgi:hypothetical protein
MRKAVFIAFLTLFLIGNGAAFGQCCSGGAGGSGSLAGDFASGTLVAGQFAFSSIYQHVHTDKFFEGNEVLSNNAYHEQAPNNYLDGFDNSQIYMRFAYGITERLTLSVETGYYLNKTEYRKDYLVDTMESTGISDLIVFPRYNIWRAGEGRLRFGATVGVGMKIPLGSNNDSALVFHDENSGLKFYDLKSPAIQLSSGSNDLLLSGTVSMRMVPQKLTLSVNTFYILMGWNSLGEKAGNYGSLILRANKSIGQNWNVIGNIKGERIGSREQSYGMAYASAADDVANSGGTRLHFMPQVNWSVPSGFLNSTITLFGFTELPLYQNMNGIQLGAQVNYSLGLVLRLNPKQETEEIKIPAGG